MTLWEGFHLYPLWWLGSWLYTVLELKFHFCLEGDFWREGLREQLPQKPTCHPVWHDPQNPGEARCCRCSDGWGEPGLRWEGLLRVHGSPPAAHPAVPALTPLSSSPSPGSFILLCWNTAALNGAILILLHMSCKPNKSNHTNPTTTTSKLSNYWGFLGGGGGHLGPCISQGKY